jgi:hypothetical protein
MAKRAKQDESSVPEDLAGMDSVSPMGGYAGVESEHEAAKAALVDPDEEKS